MVRRPITPLLAILAFTSMIVSASPLSAADVRIGILGLDTSHAVEFTMRLNDPASTNFVPGG